MVARDTSKKHGSIREAAAEIFIEEGYDNASMDRIAERANASKRTVYNHFSSKEILFRAVIRKFKEDVSQFKQINYDANRSLKEQLTDYVNGQLEIGKNPKWLGLLRMLMAVILRDPELVQEAMASSKHDHESLDRWIQAAADDGRLEVKNASLAAEIFRSMTVGSFYWPVIFSQDIDMEKFEMMRDEIISTFLARYEK